MFTDDTREYDLHKFEMVPSFGAYLFQGYRFSTDRKGWCRHRLKKWMNESERLVVEHLYFGNTPSQCSNFSKAIEKVLSSIHFFVAVLLLLFFLVWDVCESDFVFCRLIRETSNSSYDGQVTSFIQIWDLPIRDPQHLLKVLAFQLESVPPTPMKDSSAQTRET